MSEKSCCFCFSLRTGTLAIGVTMLAIGGLATASAVGALIYISQIPDKRLLYPGQYDYLRLVLGFQVAVGILRVLFNSLLVHGVRKNRTHMVLAWLVYHAVATGLQSAALSVLFAFAVALRTVPIIWIVVTGALLALFWRWFVVVLHYHKEMKQQTGEGYRQQKDDTVMLAAE